MAVVFVASLMAAMMVPTVADAMYTISICRDSADKAAHTYGAFRLFKGNLDEKTEGSTTTKTLSNIEWGDDIDQTKLPDCYPWIIAASP